MTTHLAPARRAFPPGRLDQPAAAHRGSARGFTLLELLAVIGIIVLLIAILIPTIARVQDQARATDTANQIMAIDAAIQQYKTATGSLPGPLPNSAFDATGLSINPLGPNNIKITMTENMMLGLAGGLEYGDRYDESKVGAGAINHNLNAAKRTRLKAFLEPTGGRMVVDPPWSTGGTSGPGKLLPGADNDSIVPEPVDRFPEPEPILYLRANIGAPGITHETNNSAQYNLSHLKPYDFPASPDEADFSGNTPAARWNQYFKHPSIDATPKAKDSFLLISPGIDRKFGTKDDILNVGSP